MSGGLLTMPSSQRQIELRKAKKSMRIESELSALEASKISAAVLEATKATNRADTEVR